MPPGRTHGFPVDQTAMSLAGMINGFPMPLLMAHNMDDPRSPHCVMSREGAIGAQAALTARKRGFETPEAYAEWIAGDARKKIGTPIEQQIANARLRRDDSMLGRARRRLRSLTGRLRRTA